MKNAWVHCYPLSAQRRLWSDLVDAQADLSFRWSHISFCWFCPEAAHLSFWAGAQQNDMYAQWKINLGIAQSDQPSLSAWRWFGSLTTHRGHSEDWSVWANAYPDLSLPWAHIILLVLLCFGSSLFSTTTISIMFRTFLTNRSVQIV